MGDQGVQIVVVSAVRCSLGCFHRLVQRHHFEPQIAAVLAWCEWSGFFSGLHRLQDLARHQTARVGLPQQRVNQLARGFVDFLADNEASQFSLGIAFGVIVHDQRLR